MFDPIMATEKIYQDFVSYIRTTFKIKDKDYEKEFFEQLKIRENLIKGPYLDVTDSFERDISIEEMVGKGILSKGFLNFEDKEIKQKLYNHQTNAINKAVKGKNIIVSTGTASGKTKCYLLPIINHLLKEEEEGRLTAGVRALLIYPLNALTHDQMGSIRKILANSNITFGAYTGETPKTEEEAVAKYLASRTEDQPERPLRNELISKEQMQATPPNILITNYSMLEYLLIRPKDSSFFQGGCSDSWRFIVLDEAHSYAGAKGIEISMLLRRLKQYVKGDNELQFILTSATIGGEYEDNADIIKFASSLCCDNEFDEEGIIMAKRAKIDPPKITITFTMVMYSKLRELTSKIPYDDKKFSNLMKLICDKHKPLAKRLVKCGNNLPEILFEIIRIDETFYKIKNILQSGVKTIFEVADELRIQVSELIDFISVASIAQKDGINLFEVRYHTFVKGIAGVYITLHPEKKLYISMDKETLDKEIKSDLFQLSTCKNCGGILLTLDRDDFGRPIFPRIDSKNLEYYTLSNEVKDSEFDSAFDSDSISIENEDYYYYYGNSDFITKHELFGLSNYYYKKLIDSNEVMKFKKRKYKGKEIHQCPYCLYKIPNTSVFRNFYLGNEEAATVLATSLFNMLPAVDNNIQQEQINGNYVHESSNLAVSNEKQKMTKIPKKKFLVFSDSRQDAAYFATFMSETYDRTLRKRCLLRAIKSSQGLKNSRPNIMDVVKNLSKVFFEHEIYESKEICQSYAWKTVLNELCKNEGRFNLEELGLIYSDYEVKISEDDLPKEFTEKEFQDVIKFLVNTLRGKFLLFSEYYQKTADDEEVDFKVNDNYITCDSKDKEKRIQSWCSAVNFDNIRTDFISKITNWDNDNSNDFLVYVWDLLLKQNELLKPFGNKKYKLNGYKFSMIDGLSNELTWYKCDTCGKIMCLNVRDVCSRYKCKGKLTKLVLNSEESCYFKKLYNELAVEKLVVKEHTAQLMPERGREYQKLFNREQINILSCSTTFEMGIDLKRLLTVFMRNVPPSPINYIQRSGRAGREDGAPAFTLTYCKMGPHDSEFFKNPSRMIKGEIKPPIFKVENEKIAKRHIFASVLSFFWKKNIKYFRNVEEMFIVPKGNKSPKTGIEKLVEYVKKKDQPLLLFIEGFIPSKLYESIKNWDNEFVGEEGVIILVENELKAEILNLRKNINKHIEKLVSETENLDQEMVSAAKKGHLQEIKRIEDVISSICKEDILSFLSRKNIIPKYGFPVDIIELMRTTKMYMAEKDTIRLQRDSTIGINEYAPGSEVIADGYLYKSMYVKKSANEKKGWKKYDIIACENEECNYLKVATHDADAANRKHGICANCKDKLIWDKTFLLPEHGFYTDHNIVKASINKPKRKFNTQNYFLGNSSESKLKTIIVHKLDEAVLCITSSSNEEILVLNKSPFYLCNECGYAEEGDENSIENYRLNKDKHLEPNRTECRNTTLEINHLGHIFKTDVIQITINDYLDRGKALSILYSLLEGVCSYFHIERKDISGCIQYLRNESHELSTNLVLFDQVPGGAGHVRRLNTEDNRVIRRVLLKAYEVVIGCSCGGVSREIACYNCLCNYYNQVHHSILQRNLAIKWFEEVMAPTIEHWKSFEDLKYLLVDEPRIIKITNPFAT